MMEHSWTIESETVAFKILDKSAFLHRGTGIPINLREFFGITGLGLGQKTNITLIFNGNSYPAHFIRESNSSGRTRLFWNKSFADQIKLSFPEQYDLFRMGSSLSNRINLRLIKKGGNVYEVNLLKNDEDNTLIQSHNKVLEIFSDELQNTTTRYFVLDTHGGNLHGDVDFRWYDWSPSHFNRVNPGDLFIYRRPRKASEINQFYFFGAGKIGHIEKIGEDRVRGYIHKAVPFADKLLPNDLEDFNWTIKERGETWEHFFNQYGMSTITKADFVGLLEIAFSSNPEPINFDEEVQLIQQLQTSDFSVEDHVGLQKKRIGQKVFADQVKLNYGFQCAISGILSRDFLIASHIIPWALKKESRLDPSNGICLSVFFDKAFDKGYITITPNYIVKVSAVCEQTVRTILEPYNGKKLTLPKLSVPNKDYLRWHNEHIFKR